MKTEQLHDTMRSIWKQYIEYGVNGIGRVVFRSFSNERKAALVAYKTKMMMGNVGLCYMIER
jgi:hypothetical protein